MLRNRIMISNSGYPKVKGCFYGTFRTPMSDGGSLYGTFSGNTNLLTVDLSNLDTKNVSTFGYIFTGCINLEEVNLSNWDFTNIYNPPSYMFDDNSNNLKSVVCDNWVVPQVRGTSELFGRSNFEIPSSCEVETLYVRNWLCSRTDLDNYFSGPMKVIDMTGWTCLQSITSMTYTFGNCDNLMEIKGIDCLDVSQMTSMESIFNGLNELRRIDLTNWNITNVIDMRNMFRGCYNLTEIKMGGDPYKACQEHYDEEYEEYYNGTDYMFDYIASAGTFYYNSKYDYSKILSLLPSGWNKVPLCNNIKATKLTITADNIKGSITATTIHYNATLTGNSIGDGSVITWTESGDTKFYTGKNTNTSSRQITVTFTYYGLTATTIITQDKYIPKSYSVNLNDEWYYNTNNYVFYGPNPDETLYDGVYGNAYCDDGENKSMFINIVGYNTFSIYVRSDGEECCDYLEVYDLDSTSNIKATTKDNASSSTGITSYNKVTFNNIDEGQHSIMVRYRKDSNTEEGEDRGYVLIPKNQ